MNEIIKYLKHAFMSASVNMNEVRIISLSPQSFGDFVIDVESDIGKLKITRDRGQFFVDIYGSDGVSHPAHKLVNSVRSLYAQNNWTLEDILKSIKNYMDLKKYVQ